MTDPTGIHEPVPQNARLAAREKKWIIYDVGNSAFVLLFTAVIPICAGSLVPADGNIMSAWGYAQIIASLVIALLMPLFGSIADVQGVKIESLLGFFGTGVVTYCTMALPLTWLLFLTVCILATISLDSSLTFYGPMPIDITSNERMGKVSSHGYGWGYVDSTVPFTSCIALIFGDLALFGWSTVACMRASFIITAIQWAAFTISLITSYRQVHYRATRDQLGSVVCGTFSEPAGTFDKIAKNKPLWMFMIAFFFYIGTMSTAISMSASYDAELGIDSTQLVVALFITQFVAFLYTILYGRLSDRFDNKMVITAAVVAYMCIVFFASFFLKLTAEFQILAILVGIFQGGIQALPRSYYDKIVPESHANEYYGSYDVFGKTASIIDTFLVTTTTSLTGNASLGVLSIAVLLVVALAFLLLQKDPTWE